MPAEPPLIDVLIAAPEAFAPRAAWVLATLLAPLGRRVRVVRDPAAASGCVLAYAPEPLPDVPTIPCSAAAMELFAAGRPLPAGAFATIESVAGPVVGAFPATGEATAGGEAGARRREFAAPFDLVASAFVLLACWDEHTNGERDRFDRLPYTASVFAANPALRVEEPAVDAYVDLLRAALTPRLAALGLEPLPPAGWLWRALPRGAAAGTQSAPGSTTPAGFALALTHDIDNLWRWTPRGFAAAGYRSARAVRHRDGAALRREMGDVATWATRHLPRRTDPYWTFPQMLRGEDERGVSSTFFVIARHTHPRDGNQPKTYRRRIPSALALVRAAGREVGLHGNDADRLGPAPVARDRDDLARRAGVPVEGVRFHYLRCLYHETLPYLEQAGLAYDTSLAFAEHEGFRCGVSFPFHPYCLAEERPLRLLELPLAVMDTGLHGAQYRALDAGGGERVARAILARAHTSGGAVAILWHNLRFDRRSAQGYDAVYWHLVDWALAEGGFVAAAGEIVRRWRAATEGAGEGAPS